METPGETCWSNGSRRQITTARQIWSLLDSVTDWDVVWSGAISDGPYCFFQIGYRDPDGQMQAVSGELRTSEKIKYDLGWEIRARPVS